MFHPTSEDGHGPQNLRKYILSRRHASSAVWPEKDMPVIRRARIEYDAGLIEMPTHRDADWLILYRIPRNVKAKPRSVFSGAM